MLSRSELSDMFFLTVHSPYIHITYIFLTYVYAGKPIDQVSNLTEVTGKEWQDVVFIVMYQKPVSGRV
jgi:hypothetical protein